MLFVRIAVVVVTSMQRLQIINTYTRRKRLTQWKRQQNWLKTGEGSSRTIFFAQTLNVGLFL